MKQHLNFSLALVLFTAFVFTFSCKNSGKKEAMSSEPAGPNMLTQAEIDSGWVLLFDGSNLDGWKRYNHDTIGPLWEVDSGMIVCNGEGLTEGTADIGGSLITIRQFGNFDLSVDWKISPGGNSGILYHVVEKPELAHAYETGPEYQLLDDAGWKADTAHEAIHDSQTVGSNYDMYAAPPDKNVKPAGEWNTSRLIYNNGHVTQYLNGKKTVEFDEGSADYQARYEKSKWPGYPEWNKYKTGSIGLQDHGAGVYFRNIKIKEL